MSAPEDARTTRTLRDILQFGRYAAELVSRGRAAYDRDLMLQLAAEAIILRVGEAVSRLDPAFVAAHPAVPFPQAKGIRNLIAHKYYIVDPKVVWGVLENRMPLLCRQIDEIIGRARDL
ncbi:MAG TPA: HepT-like ribonuclease domain-containing protein [Nakamurella sp.]